MTVKDTSPAKRSPVRGCLGDTAVITVEEELALYLWAFVPSKVTPVVVLKKPVKSVMLMVTVVPPTLNPETGDMLLIVQATGTAGAPILVMKASNDPAFADWKGVARGKVAASEFVYPVR